MASGFTQWEADPLFSAAEVVQDSADSSYQSPPRCLYCLPSHSRPQLEVTTGPRNNSSPSSLSNAFESTCVRELVVVSKGKAVEEAPDVVKMAKGGASVILVPMDLHSNARLSLCPGYGKNEQSDLASEG